jgi:hypothetical protein
LADHIVTLDDLHNKELKAQDKTMKALVEMRRLKEKIVVCEANVGMLLKKSEFAENLCTFVERRLPILMHL